MKFKSQICTTREQSERLLTLGLSANTADMSYYIDEMYGSNNSYLHPHPPTIKGTVPAWSLHRLMELVPIDFRESYFSLSFQDVGYSNAAHEWTYYKEGNVYECMIDCIEWLIKNGGINQDYLEGEQ